MVNTGRRKLRLPLKRLMLSKPLRAYDPFGAPVVRPEGVMPLDVAIVVVCARSSLANKLRAMPMHSKCRKVVDVTPKEKSAVEVGIGSPWWRGTTGLDG